MTSPLTANDFEMVFDISPIGMAVLGLNGQWIRVNRALSDMLGMTETELLESTFQDCTHPEDHGIGQEALLKLKCGEVESVRVEKRYVHKNGRVIYVLILSCVLKDDDGNVKYLLAQIQDVSEQKRIEEQTELIVSTALDGYWDWRIKEEIEFVSPQFWNMLGYAAEAGKTVKGKDWRKLIFHEDLQKVTEAVNLHFETKGKHPFYLELRLIKADGNLVWILCKGSVVEWDRYGKPVRMVGTNIDITDLKKAQTALAQGSKMVALGEMASGIAHEINNPLAVIVGYSNRLRTLLDQKALTNEEIIKTCDKLEQTSLRISKIVKGLRIYSREVDNEDLREISARELIEDTLSFCMEKFRSRGIDLRLKIDPENLRLKCRPIQISQVLLNLLNNAFDAVIKQPSPWIELKCEQDSKIFLFFVTDSGPGVPPSIRSQIMEPFFTTKPVGEGTGLGLSICSGLIAAHGGKVELLEGTPHTTFAITLPR